MTDKAPERLWVVEAEPNISRDELGELFAGYEPWELERFSKCYESEPHEYVRADLHADLSARIEVLEGALRKCMGELEGVARSEFEGVWFESDFDEMLLPYHEALNAKTPTDTGPAGVK